MSGLPPPPPPPPPRDWARPNDAPPPPAAAAPPPIPPDALVVVNNVSKWFGELVAVSDVSFVLQPGVTALLGPNGAGKSTVLRMLCGLAAPSNGTVEVMGRNPKTDPLASALIGIAPQQESVFEMLTALEFVEVSATLQGMTDPTAAAEHALRTVELDPTDRRRLPTYSKGMRQRVKLAQAIVHEPRILLLDEPLTGLDPRQRLQMVDLFHRLGDEGRCVVVSSHVLEEVEKFGSNVLVIAQGRLAAQGDFRAIRELMDDRPHRVRVRTDKPQILAGALVASGVVSGVRMEGDEVEIDTTDVRGLASAIAPIARRESARLLEVRALDEDLESVFRYLVRR
jgi:ABC-2 type transport system ATP-binding protein